MTSKRVAPILIVGFALLIGLTAISGIEALHRARETYREVSALNDRYRRTQRALNAIGSGIYVVGLLARDYLLDPSNVESASYRARLVTERSSMESQVTELQQAIREEDRSRLDRLRKEVDGYWNALDPLFQWTAAQKSASSWSFLRHEVLPRREAALSIAREISGLAEANLDSQRLEIDRKQASMAVFIERMLAVTVVLGVGVAGMTLLRMTRLETRSEAHRMRTEEAERELRSLSRQLVQAQEDERKSISRELHDEVGQMMTALRMELRSLQDLRTAPEEQFNEHLDGAKRLAEQSLRALRDMAMGLRPSMLDDLGLGSAVQWRARQFSKLTGIPVNVVIEDVPSGLPDLHRTCIYRVIQEALTNCARHAKAKTINIAVHGQNGRLFVTVADDGIGFDPSNVRGRGLGLIGMQERVMQLGGRLELASNLGRGTSLSATIPLPREVPGNGHPNSSGG